MPVVSAYPCTIVDLRAEESIGTAHLAETINLRSMEREGGTGL